jgi:hypothetical protein
MVVVMPTIICKTCGTEFFSERARRNCIECVDYKSRKTTAEMFEYFSVTNHPKISPLHIRTGVEIREMIRDNIIPNGTILERQDGSYFMCYEGKITYYNKEREG